MSEYEAQAERFCRKYGVRVSAAFKGDRCPPWGAEGDRKKFATCSCGATHGDRYRVTLRQTDATRRPRSVSFDFWNSHSDMQNGKRPTAYDVLACVSGDIYCPESFEEFCGEYGYDEDSRRAEAVFRRCDVFAQRLRNFFTQEEQEALVEIA